jgi:putative hydrolase
VEATLPVWQELAEPVATSIADALTSALSEQAPEDMQGLVQGAGRLMRTVGGSLFASQLGQVVGNLSKEVVSGGDVGIPLLPDGEAAILPQNFADFGRDLEVPEDQLALYVATRELAHARLFRHARWLRLHVISQVTDFARGVHVDTGALEDLASRFDPSEPEELRKAIESGALLPARSEAQNAALARLENLLATIEGWVDVVTADATSRLPSAQRIAEAVRRRRAVGGPAERALGSLVGLEIRPRRMREAAAMWRAVTDAVGPAARDALWDYPDLMPSPTDIDDPAALVARLEARARGEEPARDEMDDALARLLAGEDSAGAPAEAESADAVDDVADEADGGDEADDGESGAPEDHRPV